MSEFFGGGTAVLERSSSEWEPEIGEAIVVPADIEDVLPRVEQPSQLDTPEPPAEKAEPSNELIEPKLSFEEVVIAVSEHFGDRIFRYKTHSGTAAQMQKRVQ